MKKRSTQYTMFAFMFIMFGAVLFILNKQAPYARDTWNFFLVLCAIGTVFFTAMMFVAMVQEAKDAKVLAELRRAYKQQQSAANKTDTGDDDQ